MSLLLILSVKWARSTTFDLVVPIGSSRYVNVIVPTIHPKKPASCSTFSSSTFRDIKLRLMKIQFEDSGLSKVFNKASRKKTSSLCEAHIRIIVSRAYWIIGNPPPSFSLIGLHIIPIWMPCWQCFGANKLPGQWISPPYSSSTL